MTRYKIAVISIFLIFINSCVPITVRDTEALQIGTIQGCAHTSPYNGQTVYGIEGIVTHKFSNGFSMQSVREDALKCSSEGIFVMTGDYPNVKMGQLVQVDGRVVEYTAGKEEDQNLSRTEIHGPIIKILADKFPLPKPIKLGSNDFDTPINWIKNSNRFDINENGLDYYESLEFMLVEVDEGVVVGPKNQYNEFVVLPMKYLVDNLMTSQGVLLQKDNDENPERIIVNASSSFTAKVNVGDKITKPIIGIMDYSFGNFKMWTIENPEIENISIEKRALERNESSLSIATYNLENFSRFDDNSRVKKIACQIVKNMKSPDILILNEVMDDSGIQDDGTVTSTKTLELLLQEITQCGGPSYSYSDNPPVNNQDGGIEGGNIRTSVVYNESRVKLDRNLLDNNGWRVQNNRLKISSNPYRLFSNDPIFNGTRKPTLWLFDWNGEQIVVIGVHLVSQSANSPEWGSIQPPIKPEQLKRENQIQLIINFLNDVVSKNERVNVVLMGDFNDYPWSNTMKSLLTNDDLLLPKNNNPLNDFSYIHEGNGFVFDYAFVSSNLQNRVSDFKIIHLNTLFDSHDQISDHDPVYLQISK